MFYTVEYVYYEKELEVMLHRVFQLEEDDDEDIIFRIDFNSNNIQLNQSDLSPQRQSFIVEYQKIAQKLMEMGWEDCIKLENLLELQDQKKIEASRGRFTEENLLVSIEKWTT